VRVRSLLFCLIGLPWLTAFLSPALQESSPLEPVSGLGAIETPQIAGEIDAPSVVILGRAEIRPSPDARVLLLAADGRICGVLIDGQASLTYRVRDPFSIPLARRNAGRANGISARDSAGEMTLSASLQGAAVWGWNIEPQSKTPRPVSGATLPAWLGEALKDKIDSNPGRDMLLSAWNVDPGYRWGLFHSAGDDFVLDVDPRPTVLVESFHRVRRIPWNSGPFSGKWTTEELVAQPINKQWWDPVTVDFAALETDIQVRNDSRNHVTVRTRSRFQSFRNNLRGLSLSLLSERIHRNDDRQPYKITSLTVDGAPAPFVHWRDTLLVLLPRALGNGDSTSVEVTADGEILERPEGDNYWRLAIEPWYPQPQVGGTERAAFNLSVETNAPFVPFAAGEIVRRETTGQVRRVVTRLNGPMQWANVLAGNYTTFTDESDGARIHVSTYASAKKDDALRVANIVQGVRSCLASWLGVPYPFQDLQVIEINQWGWGQAPAGIIYVTREAFLTRLSAATLDEESTMIAQQVSRGINERLAHEVAHAWFPHVAKVDRTEENWLSESLADYMSAACLERMDPRRGKAMFNRQLSDWKTMAGGISSGSSIYLAGHLGSRQEDWRDWQSLLYARGPLVLHALRQELARTAGSQREGDKLFFTWLRSYVKNFTFKTGETRHLVGILSQITKKDWQPWFERYVYGTETPKLE
jgi:hypothetical protein